MQNVLRTLGSIERGLRYFSFIMFALFVTSFAVELTPAAGLLDSFSGQPARKSALQIVRNLLLIGGAVALKLGLTIGECIRRNPTAGVNLPSTLEVAVGNLQSRREAVVQMEEGVRERPPQANIRERVPMPLVRRAAQVAPRNNSRRPAFVIQL